MSLSKKLEKWLDDYFIVIKLAKQLRKELKRYRADKRDIQFYDRWLRRLILRGYAPQDAYDIVLADFKAYWLQQRSSP